MAVTAVVSRHNSFVGMLNSSLVIQTGTFIVMSRLHMMRYDMMGWLGPSVRASLPAVRAPVFFFLLLLLLSCVLLMGRVVLKWWCGVVRLLKGEKEDSSFLLTVWLLSPYSSPPPPVPLDEK